MQDETGRPLLAEEKQILLTVAHEAVNAAVRNQPLPKLQYTSPVFKEKRGAFVTLRNNDKLRGCIGFVLALRPLLETVVEMAQAAALSDPRFTPIAPEELPDLNIEISVLSPLQTIQDISEIQVGVHGIYVKKGVFNGILLPQVAVEYGWDRTTFLQQTCFKAGLPLNAWQDDDAEIKIFSAQVFSDLELA